MSNGISLDEKLVQQLVAAASTAMKASYSPYSKFPVGSAVLCADNSIVTAGDTGFCDDPKSCFVILTKPDGSFLVKSLEELLPYSFGPESLLSD
ncbi:PREDICTED: cytidine deaminase-like [Priapulus caudatus]|uniref:Cytidine deaminase-like n=1 Tax=Priapulus caudatus TaxID=37621 RepID=A0ABM1F3P1_PRICU|nr:PREDICTED: cytidine deaminase-like [Priapulus caudatus]